MGLNWLSFAGIREIFALVLVLQLITTLMLSIIPNLNHVAFGASRIPHILVLYLVMSIQIPRVGEWDRLTKQSDAKKKKELVNNFLNVIWMNLLVLLVAAIIDGTYFGGVIIYYGCVFTNELLQKGILFVILVSITYLSQFCLDIWYIYQMSRMIEFLNKV